MGDGVLVYFGYPRAHEDDRRITAAEWQVTIEYRTTYERIRSATTSLLDAVRVSGGGGGDQHVRMARLVEATTRLRTSMHVLARWPGGRAPRARFTTRPGATSAAGSIATAKRRGTGLSSRCKPWQSHGTRLHHRNDGDELSAAQ
jgi:hypothetical protein